MAAHARDHPAVHPTVCILDICFIDGLELKKEERLAVEAVDLRAPIFGGVPEVFCPTVSHMRYSSPRPEGTPNGGVL